MDRGVAALLTLILIVFVLYLVFSIPRTTVNSTVATTPAVAPAVVINNPDSVVVSDRAAVSDVVPVQTVPAQTPTYYGSPITVARTMPADGCTGVCTTACPTQVISGYCPVGTICCI